MIERLTPVFMVLGFLLAVWLVYLALEYLNNKCIACGAQLRRRADLPPAKRMDFGVERVSNSLDYYCPDCGLQQSRSGDTSIMG